MTEEEMRNAGYSYEYIRGYQDGENSGVRGKDLDEYLSDLRNDGTDYEYIKGYEEGYFE